MALQNHKESHIVYFMLYNVDGAKAEMVVGSFVHHMVYIWLDIHFKGSADLQMKFIVFCLNYERKYISHRYEIQMYEIDIFII